MSFDADEEELREAVARGDADWVWSAVQDAYEQRDWQRPRVVSLDLRGVDDAEGFHAASAAALGFPSFYGRNLDAWIDCMTHLDDPQAGMTGVHVHPGQVLVLEVLGMRALRDTCPELYLALLESAAFVNHRRLELGQPAILALSYATAVGG